MRSQLTELSVRSLKPEPGKQIKVWDTKTPGFGVRVNDRSKSWIVMFGHKRQLKVLGRYPDMPLADARKKALVAIGSADDSVASAPFFDTSLQRFLELHGATLKERSRKEIERTLKRHFLPSFQTKTLDKISHADIAEVLDEIVVDRPGEALHAFKDIRTFFRWCVPRYIPFAPTDRMKPPSRYIPRKRVLSDAELVAVWRALDADTFSAIVKLLILTGQRWGEVASLRSDYINVKTKTITLPETKNGRVHTFPFGDIAAGILDAAPRLNSTTLLFPGRDDQKPWNGAGKAKWL